MIVNGWAEFRADFPDDYVEEDGEIVQFGGKAIAEAVADMLGGFGCVVEAVANRHQNGWWCDFAYERLALRFQVVDLGDECLLIFHEPHRATRKISRYGEALMKLNQCLRQDGRFHDLIWYNYDGRNPRKNPSDVPVIGGLTEEEDADSDDRWLDDRKKLSFLEKLLAPLRRR